MTDGHIAQFTVTGSDRCPAERQGRFRVSVTSNGGSRPGDVQTRNVALCPRRDDGPIGHRDATSARERGTGERKKCPAAKNRSEARIPQSDQAATLTGGADRVGVRLPDRGQATDAPRRGRAGCPNSLSINAFDKLFGGTGLRGGDHVGGTCRIAAKRLTLTGGADRVGVRLPDRGQAADAHRRCLSCERPAAR